MSPALRPAGAPERRMAESAGIMGPRSWAGPHLQPSRAPSLGSSCPQAGSQLEGHSSGRGMPAVWAPSSLQGSLGLAEVGRVPAELFCLWFF